MTIPNVDTFEHDVSEEIKHKEASFTDIASASGDVGNIPQAPSRSPYMMIALVFLAIVVLSGAGVYLFLHSNTTETPVTVTPEIHAEDQSNTSLKTLSPNLDESIGGYIQKVTSSEYGYTLTLSSYSPVFAYMLKNETAYGDELLKTFGFVRDASSTQPIIFTDTTISNQNMRVGTSGSSTVVYAFVNTQALIISSSTEGILKLRSGILTK